MNRLIFRLQDTTPALPNRIQPPCKTPSTHERQIVTDLIYSCVRCMFATWPPEPAGFYDITIDRGNTPTRVLHKFKHKMYNQPEYKWHTPEVRDNSDSHME